MAVEHRLPPSASSLSESMRDLGYSLETAIADIIDNSISAKATEIDIFCNLAADNPALCITDNGKGMTVESLLLALTHGAISPKAKRLPTDLGRFGLGLKTASFSQCRELTVITSQKGKKTAAQWDLDLVDKRDDWIVTILDDQEITDFEFVEILPSNGTMVVWKKLDRLFEDMSGVRRDEVVNEKLALVENHLALVFHRFLVGEFKLFKKLAVRINGHKVVPFDPFCRANKATQLMPEEKVLVDGETVRIQPFILPHHSKLSAAEYDFYQDRSDFISNQGAYVYRNGRLMAWGDWFRLVPKGEATKLARVQIDFPNTLDESWTIDIKKSRARPPQAVRARLRQIIAKITNSSTRVHRGRGKKLFDEIEAPLWERYADQENVRYAVNAKHPLVESIANVLSAEHAETLSTVLEVIASSLPIEMIYSDFSMSPQDLTQACLREDEIVDKLRSLKEMLDKDGSIEEAAFREILRSTRLFEQHSHVVEKYIEGGFL